MRLFSSPFLARLMKSTGLILAAVCASTLIGCGDPEPPELTPWEMYEIDPPVGDVLDVLVQSPYLYPEKVCSPVDEGVELPDGAEVEYDSDGQRLLCIWESVVGCAPEGVQYTEVSDCTQAFTQAPSWFVEPTQRFVSDPALMDDPDFVAELDWVQAQVESSGCACCHASGINSGNTSGFDVHAPQVWTDTMETYQIAMLTGEFADHSLFGAVDSEDNHGFIRDHTMFPSTDPERMKAFFLSEFERRGGTEENEQEAEEGFETFFGRLFEPYSECVSPWQGMEDDRVVWESGDSIRQFYVLEESADTPGFPPTLDKPDGTVWAIYVSPDQDPIPSGSIQLGEVPTGAVQVIPEDGSPPVFTPGTTYRLFATPDFQLIREINCTITYTEPGLD